MVGILLEGAANLEGLGLFCEALQELVVDTRLDEYPRTGTAHLTVVPAGRVGMRIVKRKTIARTAYKIP